MSEIAKCFRVVFTYMELVKEIARAYMDFTESLDQQLVTIRVDPIKRELVNFSWAKICKITINRVSTRDSYSIMT